MARRGVVVTVRDRPAPGTAACTRRTSSRARSRRVSASVRLPFWSTGGESRRVALVTAEDVPGAGTLRVLLSDVGVPLTVLILLAILVAAFSHCFDFAFGSASQNDHHRHTQRRHRQDARRAELPARPAPPRRRADRHGRRQGRERGARAAGSRPAGDRDRRGRRPHRHPHRRAPHRGGHPQRLRAHPRGVAHLDGGRGPHERRADRDQRARPARDRDRARAVRRQAPVPRRRAPRCA